MKNLMQNLLNCILYVKMLIDVLLRFAFTFSYKKIVFLSFLQVRHYQTTYSKFKYIYILILKCLCKFNKVTDVFTSMKTRQYYT